MIVRSRTSKRLDSKISAKIAKRFPSAATIHNPEHHFKNF
jgi:hypothetical protein